MNFSINLKLYKLNNMLMIMCHFLGKKNGSQLLFHFSVMLLGSVSISVIISCWIIYILCTVSYIVYKKNLYTS